MKKNFETITLEIVTIYDEDVIRTSSYDNVESMIEFPEDFD
jgi:hypothetical protein